MKVFLSWSGEQSKAVASALHGWLPSVIQAIEPWMSDKDIAKGVNWHDEIARRLDESDFGIICITSSNQGSAWLLFEAGAIAKKHKRSHACPYLLGLSKSNLKPPLSLLQATEAVEADTKKLVFDLNLEIMKAKGNALSEPAFERGWAKWWPDLETDLAKALKSADTKTPKRTSDEMIEETLTLVRQIAAQVHKDKQAAERVAHTWKWFPWSEADKDKVESAREIIAQYLTGSPSPAVALCPNCGCQVKGTLVTGFKCPSCGYEFDSPVGK